MLVVVDRQPTGRGPTVQVLSEHLGEKRRLSIGILGYLKTFEQTTTGAWDYRRGRCDERASDDNNVCGRPRRSEPRHIPVRPRAHCSNSTVLPVTRSATSSLMRASDSSRARISLGRSMIRRGRILGFD